MAIGADAEERDRPRAVAPDLGGQALAPGDEFPRFELIRGCGGAVDQVDDAVARFQQLELLGWMQLPRREPGAVQRRPEPVARAREVMAGGARIQSRIDAAEQDPQAP